MFFPRLRNQAKWAFVFLILVFGGGFVFLGVGSGGLDLGQLLRDAFGNKGPSTGSLSDAQKRVNEHPRDAAARRKLADVLEKKGRIDEAISAWTQYTNLRPRDVGALRHLGDLELGQAQRYLQKAQLAALAQQEAGAGSPFVPSPTGKFGQALGQDPIASAVSTKASAELQDASAKYQSAAAKAVTTYQKIVKVRPDDEQAFFSLAQAADTLQRTDVAIPAYKRLLEFDLDPSTKAQIRERIKTLRQSSQASSGGG
jgi:tetratricopeptide (TPR) repeat protein